MYLLFFLAYIPIIWLMISLGKLKIAGHKACPIAFFITVLIAIFIWKMNITNVFTASLECIAVATAATSMLGSEWKILSSALKVRIFYIVIAGVLVFFCGSIFEF